MRDYNIKEIAERYPNSQELWIRALEKYVPGIRRGPDPTAEEVEYAFEAALLEGKSATAKIILDGC